MEQGGGGRVGLGGLGHEGGAGVQHEGRAAAARSGVGLGHEGGRVGAWGMLGGKRVDSSTTHVPTVTAGQPPLLFLLPPCVFVSLHLHHSLRDDVALHDAAEDVDQDGLDARVGGDDLEGGRDLGSLGGATNLRGTGAAKAQRAEGRGNGAMWARKLTSGMGIEVEGRSLGRASEVRAPDCGRGHRGERTGGPCSQRSCPPAC